MLSKPAISIITPVWNGLPYLKECVNSVLTQEFSDWEMLIGDNCSTDGTLEYLDELSDPRIKVFKQEKNRGIFGNLNFLFSKASGAISQILCADDYFVDTTSVNKIVEAWQGASASAGIMIFNQNEPGQCSLTTLQRELLPSVIQPSDSDFLFYLFGNIPGNLSNVSVLTRLVNEGVGFREDLPYAGDFEFWSRTAAAVPLAVQKISVTYVRRHEGVASNYLNRKGELISQNAFVISQLYARLLKRYPKAQFAIKLHGTLNYDTLQRDIALKLFLKGKKDYMNVLNRIMKTASFSMPFLTRWGLYIATAGGRLGRYYAAKYLLSKVEFNNSIPK